MFLRDADKAYRHWQRMIRIQSLADEAIKEFPHKKGIGLIVIRQIDYIDNWFSEYRMLEKSVRASKFS